MMDAVLAASVDGSDSGLREALTSAHLPIDDLAEAGRCFFRFDRDGRTVGYGGYEAHGAHALLRSLVVLPELRGQGLGRAIAEEVMQRAAAQRCADVFLLTTSAADFFEHLGFRRLERDAAPPEILATRQAATICATATLLVRRLDG